MTLVTMPIADCIGQNFAETFSPVKWNKWTAPKFCVQDKNFNERASLLFTHCNKPSCYQVLQRVLHALSGKTFICYLSSETKKDEVVIRSWREIVFQRWSSLLFSPQFQYIKMCTPSKISKGGGQTVQEGLGMDNIIIFSISPDLKFSITLVSIMNSHNHLCIPLSPKILKEFFAKYVRPENC